MESVVSKDAWYERAAVYLRSEGCAERTEEEVAMTVPRNVWERIEKLEQPSIRSRLPMSLAAVREKNDLLAPWYDLERGVHFGVDCHCLVYLALEFARGHPTLVVDAGCGTGVPLVFLARAFPETKFIAYDVSPAMVALARARVQKHHLTNVREIFVADHVTAGQRLGGANAAVVIEKESFCDGESFIQPFWAAPDSEKALRKFVRKDPTMQQWRTHIQAFARVLRQKGEWHAVGAQNLPMLYCIVAIAEQCGFGSRDRDGPVFFNEEDKGPARDCATFGGALGFLKMR